MAYIEAGIGADRKRKAVEEGQRVSFLFPYSQQVDQLDAKAFDESGQELYYYGYPKEAVNIFDDKDLKWHE
ncbi:hypothetical protein LCL96_14260 [Rossellomorea aquimaris]|uniref:hypothetical protein n=1 Tax=Rossellomorea aquimaris TaxID=189382 RepID=UPI001CD3F673|nr:hypothetical protein [Rossellomorea aquimaris]MCA1060098.1 hypothetical protein [Rossellomorea aquimaris]